MLCPSRRQVMPARLTWSPLNFIAAILLSCFPATYREKLAGAKISSGAALVSGAVETAISAALLVHRYSVFMAVRLNAIPTTAMLRVEEQGGDTAVRAFGVVFLLEYLIHLTTLILLFFALEGFVRAITAWVSGEVLPSLPLFALSVLQGRLGEHRRERRLGARVPDEVKASADGESLEIASCRAKPWTRLTTISHDGGFYEVMDEQTASPPRAFVYLLRKKSVGSVIRGIHNYHPNEVLQMRD